MIEMKDSWHDLEDCWIFTQGFESMVGLRNAEDSFNQIFANSQCSKLKINDDEQVLCQSQFKLVVIFLETWREVMRLFC